MSLINEALKKAQRVRGDPDASANVAPGAPIARREQPRNAQTTLLIAAGAILLAVLSAVVTAFWISRPPARSSPPSAPVASTASPVVAVPSSNGNAAPAHSGESSAVVALRGSPPAKPSRPTPVVAAPAPSPSASPIARAEPPPPPKSNDRVHQFIDALRVTGIRSSGSDSRVLMNDRVYRVNDVVDRPLGIRLTKVSPDSLTFTDANGATYVKYF
ncbi:MAG TPA: hypothetical protein VHE61_13345 [Opitutaceae bacterium]|nr:hypothetical protein [Opitutaceae bacterium]